jgi:hypothetical protein
MCPFPVKVLFPFPPIPDKFIGDFFDNRQGGANIFLSTITAPIYSLKLFMNKKKSAKSH